MTVLGVVDPKDCDAAGLPLDWDRCRNCAGTTEPPDLVAHIGCEVCDGHGSLKAAALFEMAKRQIARMGVKAGPSLRCESCSHPMSEGMWEPDPVLTSAADREGFLRRVMEAGFDYTTFVHYSACDTLCDEHRELGPGRIRGEGCGGDLTITPGTVEASWRPVDIRTLGWAHDLRPERLAVLCLRCFAARSEV